MISRKFPDLDSPTWPCRRDFAVASEGKATAIPCEMFSGGALPGPRTRKADIGLLLTGDTRQHSLRPAETQGGSLARP